MFEKNLKNIISVCSGLQKSIYEQMLKDLKHIHVSSIHEVFTPEEITYIKKCIKPVMKECYVNAYRLSEFMTGVDYCEGQLMCCGIPIDHAFNKYKGKYIDITIEIALNSKIDDEYILFKEYPYHKMISIVLDNGYYGDVYITELKKSLK